MSPLKFQSEGPQHDDGGILGGEEEERGRGERKEKEGEGQIEGALGHPC